MVEYAIKTDLEIQNGPIWIQIEVSSFTGDRDTSPEITNEDLIEIENHIWEVVKSLKQGETPEEDPELPLEFTGEITERDLYCFADRDIVASCFLRLPEDFIGVKILWNFAQELVEKFQDDMRYPFSVRNVQVVAEGWVKQHHPEIVGPK